LSITKEVVYIIDQRDGEEIEDLGEFLTSDPTKEMMKHEKYLKELGEKTALHANTQLAYEFVDDDKK
jgi:hypothetical protein